MNFTIAALHLARLYSNSPMLAQTHRMPSVRLTKLNMKKMFSPVLYISATSFKDSISLSSFVQVNKVLEARSLEHGDIRDRVEFLDIGLDVYDCYVQSRSPDAHGGAFAIANEYCTFTTKRVVFEQCTCGKNGGAISAKAKYITMTHTLFIDCACAAKGNVMYAISDELTIKSSAICAHFPSQTKLGEATIDTENLQAILSNLNVTQMACKTSDSFGHFKNQGFEALFCTVDSCQFINTLVTIQSTTKLGFGYSNFISNTGSNSEAMIALTGTVPELRFALNIFKQNNDCDYIFNYVGGDQSKSSVYIIQCSFDVAFGDVASNETTLVDVDSLFDQESVVPHSLWRGGDKDYVRLARDVTETWIPTKANTLVVNIWDDKQMAVSMEAETYTHSLTYSPEPVRPDPSSETTQTVPVTASSDLSPSEEPSGHDIQAMKIALYVCTPLAVVVIAVVVLVFIKRNKDENLKDMSSSSVGRLALRGEILD